MHRIILFDVFTTGGGVPTVAGRLVRGLARVNVHSIVVDPFGDSRELMQLDDRDCRNISIVRVALPHAFRELAKQSVARKVSLAFAAPAAILRLAEIFRRNGPAVVIYNLPKSAALALPAARLSRCPTVFYCHGVQFQSDVNAFYKVILRLSSHVIVVSCGTMQQVLSAGVDRRKISVVYNGLDTAVFSGGVRGRLRGSLKLSEREFIFTYVGNLIRRKGVDVLVCAFIRLVEQYGVTAHLVMVGTDVGEEGGAYVSDLKRAIGSAGVHELVHWLGFRRDIPDVLADTDVFVMPSRMESFGLSIVEAMAAGVPVIATASGSISEVVQDGVSGVLVPPCDVECLAAAMYDLYVSKERRDLLGKNGKLRAAAFSLDRQVEGVLSVVKALWPTP